MKYYLTLIFTFFFLAGFLVAQSADSSKNKSDSGQKESEQSVQKVKEKQDDTKESERKSQQKENVKLEGFIDLNGNGIDDRLEGKQRSKGKGKGKGEIDNKDRFIDLDGDGICDGKESALGLRKVYRKRKGRSDGK